MNLPKKYIKLINLFIEKRDNKCGGVEGYATSFKMAPTDWQPIVSNEKELIQMLDILKEESIRIKDEKGEPYYAPVILDYKQAQNRRDIKIIGCTTEALKLFKKKIICNAKISLIKLDKNKKTAEYNNIKVKLKSAGLKALSALIESPSEAVSYSLIWQAVYNEDDTIKDPGIEQKRKDVYGLIDGIRRRMVNAGFPENFISVSRTEGYKLEI